MRQISLKLSAFAATLLMVAVAGCATDQAQWHKAHHPDASAARQGDNSMGGRGMMDNGMMDKDMMAMCGDMHEKMMSAKTPEERQAIMQERMKSMSPEMQQRMRERMGSMSCK
jgi:hypothetical protein